MHWFLKKALELDWEKKQTGLTAPSSTQAPTGRAKLHTLNKLIREPLSNRLIRGTREARADFEDDRNAYVCCCARSIGLEPVVYAASSDTTPRPGPAVCGADRD